MAEILTRENDKIRVTWRDNGTMELVDKLHDARWETYPVALQEPQPIEQNAVWVRNERTFCELYPGRFRAESIAENAIRMTILGRLGEEMGQFTVRTELDDQWLVVRLEDIDETLPNLNFPSHIESASLVLPFTIGRWVKKPTPGYWFWRQSTNFNMRWFGGLKEDNDKGWIAIFEDGYSDSGLYHSQMAATSLWMKTMENWTPCSLRIGFTDGGYVGQAKTFRKYAMEHGMYKSLEEKMQERPIVQNLLGGRILSVFQAFTQHVGYWEDQLKPVPDDARAENGQVRVLASHADIKTIMEDAKSLGMSNGVFNLRGWIRGGYDETYPDTWPPEPALGSLEELKYLMSGQDDFITVLHDNYQDIYPRVDSFPEGVIRNPDGSLLVGGYWHGEQCYILNARHARKNVARNWENQKTLGPRGVFLDTLAGVQFYEDYTPDNRLTRTEDWQNKLEIVKFYLEKGMLVGTECGTDYVTPYVDWDENRHVHVVGESIPLWPLVYHDALFSARYAGGTEASEATNEQEDMLWGYTILWPTGDMANWKKNRDRFAHTLRVDEFHKKIGADEMTNHRYRTPDCTVEQTEFSSGVSVMANFADHDQTIDGVTVPANDFVVLD
jgi:hypothetical protein